MRSFPRLFFAFSALLVFQLAWWASKTPLAIKPDASTTYENAPPTPPPFPNSADSWILVDLPADATQLEYGAEIYRLVCSPCHAYDGTGLTVAWRATWNPEDQNCWQSKCHGYNHPPDGFYLPNSPPVIGPIIPALFETAFDLNVYNYETMPWHNPRSMNEKEVLAVTAFILNLNQIDPGSNLTVETAKQIRLRNIQPQVSRTQTTAAPPTAVSSPDSGSPSEDSSNSSNNYLWLLGGISVGGIIMAGYLYRRASQS
jgi:cytochrome c5